MKINLKVLGTGCAKCKSLEKVTAEVVKENNFDAEITKIEDIVKIMGYGVMSTPALVVNEKVVFSGYIPSKAEITTFIMNQINE